MYWIKKKYEAMQRYVKENKRTNKHHKLKSIKYKTIDPAMSHRNSSNLRNKKQCPEYKIDTN